MFSLEGKDVQELMMEDIQIKDKLQNGLSVSDDKFNYRDKLKNYNIN
jgi:hypothetical protein